MKYHLKCLSRLLGEAKLSHITRSNNCFSKIVLFLLLSSSATTFANDSDGDGLSDQVEIAIGAEAYLSDTDGDGVSDDIEVGKNHDNPLDSDSDSILDILDYDDDNDGLPTYLEAKIDTDNDGLLDYLDKDSDNDGIPDGEESGVLHQDKNHDGVDDAFDTNRVGAVDNNGDGIDDNVKLPDHNNDGKPDYLDVNYQHRIKKANKPILVKKQPSAQNIKEELVVVEKQQNAIDLAKKQKTIDSNIQIQSNEKVSKVGKAIVEAASNKGSEIAKVVKKSSKVQAASIEELVINRRTDTDNDGLSNLLEKRLGTNHLKRDSDGDNVSDAIEIGLDINSPQDSDRDGIIDALDNDDDNDGILTKFEDLNKDSTAINDDTDADGVPNYLDANDDGDDKLTKNESYTLDSDKDGIPDYLDKNDGFKDPAMASIATDNKEIDVNKEPEVIVLYDGNAAELAEEFDQDELIANETNDDMGFSDKFDEIALEDTASVALAKASVDSHKNETQIKKNEVQQKTKVVRSTKINATKSAWDLF